MKRPSARDYFLSEIMPLFSRKTYEEYVLETSIKLGRSKGSPDSLLDHYRKHSLEKLEFSNSIEIDYVCKTILEITPELRPFLSRCFVAVTPETEINAGAFSRTDAYDGHIIQINAGIVNWFTFFVAPFVTATWYLDRETSEQDKDGFKTLFLRQMGDLASLKNNNVKHSDVNKLNLPFFPKDEMWLEDAYYKQAALTFIILHEIGYHALRHTDQAWLALFKSNLSDYTSCPENEKYQRELEADYFAARCVVEWVKKTTRDAEDKIDDKISIQINSFLMGPLLVFLGLAYLFENFEIESDTHPSLEKRLHAYIEFYLTKCCDYGQTYGMYITRIQ